MAGSSALSLTTSCTRSTYWQGLDSLPSCNRSPGYRPSSVPNRRQCVRSRSSPAQCSITTRQDWEVARRRDVLLAGSAPLVWLALRQEPAEAFGPVSVKLTDIKMESVPCPGGTVTVTGGENFGAVCLKVTATAQNPNSKPVFNADVFGRVYDANGEACIDDTENIRISYIEEIPAGSSPVSFQLTVAKSQYELGPLTLKGFKATGFAGKNLPGQGSGRINARGNEFDCSDPDLADIEGCSNPEEDLIR